MLIRILSAGVITAIVAGFFSLWVSFSNNKRLVKLEKSRQRFEIEQKQFKSLQEAYVELLSILPYNEKLAYRICNEQFEENTLLKAYEIAVDNSGKLYSHYQRYCFLLLADEQEKFNNVIEKTDKIVEEIEFLCIEIEDILSSDIIMHEESKKIVESIEKINEKKAELVKEYIMQEIQLEEMYYEIYVDRLTALSKVEEGK